MLLLRAIGISDAALALDFGPQVLDCLAGKVLVGQRLGMHERREKG